MIVEATPASGNPPAFIYACRHCGQFLQKSTWEANCPKLTGATGVLHSFTMIRKPS
jgi:hypothetical protein